MKKFEHGGNIYANKNPVTSWLDFSANINPFGLSAKVRDSIKSNIENLVNYPDPNGSELKQSISSFYKVNESAIILGNGAVELLYIFFHTFEIHRVLIPVPSFSEYERAALAAGCQVQYLLLAEEEDFKLNLDKLMEILPGFDCFVLGNPNNPTGCLLTREQLMRIFGAAASNSVQIIVDESFVDFLQDSQKYSVIDLVSEYTNLFVLQSLTKFYAIPGLRLGFGVLSPQMIQKMELGKDPWNVNLLAQNAGVAGLADKEYQQASRRLVAEEKRWLYEQLKKFDCFKVYEPAVNFIFLRLLGRKKSSELVNALRDKGILIRDCSNYPGLSDEYVRVAVKDRENNQRLVKALKECIYG